MHRIVRIVGQLIRQVGVQRTALATIATRGRHMQTLIVMNRLVLAHG